MRNLKKTARKAPTPYEVPGVGAQFGHWTFVRETAPRVWYVRCVCGEERSVDYRSLRRGLSASCGCQGKGLASRPPTSVARTEHGRDYRDKTYRTWRNAKNRVSNPRTPKYAIYGGVGITMCEEWFNSFDAFLRDVGYPPSPVHSIDRIDNRRGYEPGNVRWATAEQQMENRTVSLLITIGGVTKTLGAWARTTGINYGTARRRLGHGLPAEMALNPDIRYDRKEGKYVSH